MSHSSIRSKPSSLGHDPLAWLREEEPPDEPEVRPEAASKSGSMPLLPAGEGGEESTAFLADPSINKAVTATDQPAVPPGEGVETLETSDVDLSMDLGEILGIADLQDLHEQFTGLLDAGGEVRLDAGQLKMVDTATLQLLYAFRQEAGRRGQRVEWAATSEAFCTRAGLIGMQQALGLPG